MPAAAPEVVDKVSDQDSPNSSPDTGLTVAGIAIATVFLLGGLVVGVTVLVRKQKQAKLKRDMPAVEEYVEEQQLGPIIPTPLGDKPLGHSALGDKPAVTKLMVDQV